MSTFVKVGTITSPTSTGSVLYDFGIGDLKAVWFFFKKQTSVGSGVDFISSEGFAISSSSRRARACVYLDNVAGGTINMGRNQSNAHVIYGYNTTAVSMSAFLVADITSFVGGATLNWSTVQASGYLVSYIAIGGTEPSFTMKSIQAPGSTGLVAYTGAGAHVANDMLFTISNSDTSTGPGTSHNSGARTCIGFGTLATHKTTASTSDETAGKFHAKAQKTAIALAVDAVAGTILFEAVYSANGADGYSWTWNTVSANRYVEVISVKGMLPNVGVFNQATGTGNQEITGLINEPMMVFMTSANAAASTSVSSGAKISMGAAQDASNRWATWHGSSGDPTVVDHYHDTGNVIQCLTEGTPTIVTTADYVRREPNKFIINNTAVDATSREFPYFTLGGKSNYNKLLNVNQAGKRAALY